VQREHRAGKLLSNREALDALRLLGVERVECLQVYGKASEFLFYQATKRRNAAGPAQEEAATAEEEEEEGEEEEEEADDELTVAHIDAVAGWLRDIGVEPAAIPAVITGYPAVLAFSVPERLAPLSTFLREELGVPGADLAAALVLRPSLLGLDPSTALRRIVDFLRSTGAPREQIVEQLLRSV